MSQPGALTLLATADLSLTAATLLSPPADAGPLPSAADVGELARRLGIDDVEPLLVRALDALGLDAAAPGDEHRRLFDGATACPPNETAYVRRDKGALLADIAGFYRAFGFEIEPAAGEKLDHVVAELQFVALLLVQTARAAADGRDEQREIAFDAVRAFLDDHLLAWLDSFALRLEQVAGRSPYVELPEIVRTAARVLADTVGLARPALTVAPESASGTPYECGRCAGAGVERPLGPVPPRGE